MFPGKELFGHPACLLRVGLVGNVVALENRASAVTSDLGSPASVRERNGHQPVVLPVRGIFSERPVCLNCLCQPTTQATLTLAHPSPTIRDMLRISVLVLSTVFAGMLLAQAPGAPQPAAKGRGKGSAAPAQPAYSVHPDRTVTFTLRAPEAADVKVSGDFTQNALNMTKAQDGTWSVTTGPLRPALYNYAFTVNGVRVVDPANPMLGAADRGSGSSLFEVKGDHPAPWDVQPVPHGAVHINYYVSKKFEAPRMVYIYTPPGYETSSAKYPTL